MFRQIRNILPGSLSLSLLTSISPLRRLFILAAATCLVISPLSVRADDLFVSFGLVQGQVYQYAPDGTTIVGTGPSGSWTNPGTGSDPFGIRFGPDGDLYVANVLGGTVQRFSGTTGNLIDTVASGLSNPYDVAFDSGGNMYVSEYGGGKVDRYAQSGGGYTFQSAINISTPTGLAMRGSDLLVSSFNQKKVLEINSSFNATSLFATVADNPRGLTLGPDGRYYAVTDYAINVLDPLAQSSSVWGASTLSGFQYNGFLAFGNGKAYATSEQGVRVFNANAGSAAGSIENLYDNRHDSGIAIRSSPVPEPAFYQMTVLLTLCSLGVLRHRRARRS